MRGYKTIGQINIGQTLIFVSATDLHSCSSASHIRAPMTFDWVTKKVQRDRFKAEILLH